MRSGRRVRRLAVLTSGGDAPGMNAAIRAVVRAAAARDIRTVGVRNGFAGLLEGQLEPLSERTVGGILQRGGTVLGSARCPAFREPETQGGALRQLEAAGVDGLVVIGGNGSQQGTLALHRLGFPVVGVASTIDNDLAVTETTIGVDTALNTAAGYIDRLKDTASSHHRAFVVEVMGRDSGYLALMSAIATGAELAVVPERAVEREAVAEDVERQYARGKLHYIIVVAEGARLSARDLTDYLCQHPCGFEARLSVLGHVQRGGSPTVFDRILAGRLGACAVEALAAGRTGVVVGWKAYPAEIPLEAAIAPCSKVTSELLALAETLAR
jgi:6-phosphofructokinase 1